MQLVIDEAEYSDEQMDETYYMITYSDYLKAEVRLTKNGSPYVCFIRERAGKCPRKLAVFEEAMSALSDLLMKVNTLMESDADFGRFWHLTRKQGITAKWYGSNKFFGFVPTDGYTPNYAYSFNLWLDEWRNFFNTFEHLRLLMKERARK